MTIEELNKLIKEELNSFLNEEEDGDDIEVTTDEPAAETGEEAMDLLRQIYDMIKPEVESEEGEEEPEMDMDDEEGEEEPEMDMDDEEGEEGEEIEEGVLSESGFTDLFEPAVRGMMDGDKIKLAIDNLLVAKMAAGMIFTIAISMGIENRNSIKASLEAIAQKAKGRVAKFATKILGDEALLDAIEGQQGKVDVDEAVGYSNYRADQISKVKADADDVNKGLNESIDQTARFKKLANIKG